MSLNTCESKVRLDAILNGLTTAQATELVELLCGEPHEWPEYTPEKCREELVRLALSRRNYELARRQRDLMRDPLRLDRQLRQEYVWYPWVKH